MYKDKHTCDVSNVFYSLVTFAPVFHNSLVTFAGVFYKTLGSKIKDAFSIPF